MDRQLYKNLLKWKTSARRKPLLLRGARQTGKTYLLQEFGRLEYDSCISINFEKDPSAAEFFSDRLDAHELVRNLSIYIGRNIRPERDLIVFDEIQASNRALSSLKYFQEQAPEYHIAAAGSLLGIAVSGPGSFPVGKVNFLDLYPLTFFEFLDAVGAKELKELVHDTQSPEPYPEPLHKELLRHLRSYYFTGGMPEAVSHFASSGNLAEVREIQNEILGAYVLDFAKYAAGPDIPKLRMIWDSIPAQLSKENKKFVFSVLKKSARLRDFDNAIQWLEKAGLIHRVFRVGTAKRPLKAYAEENIFKMYALDIGLLGALAGITADILVRGDKIFREFEGALVENYVVQELKAAKGMDLYYWESRGTAEVDFVCEDSDFIYPLEAKAGVNPRSKSLSSFDQKFDPPYLGRTSQLNLKRDGRILNIPLYAVSLFPMQLGEESMG
jgi:hypothetical protein